MVLQYSYIRSHISCTHTHTHTNTHLLEVIAGVTKLVSSTCSSCSSLFLRVEAAILNTTDNNESITIYLINKRWQNLKWKYKLIQNAVHHKIEHSSFQDVKTQMTTYYNLLILIWRFSNHTKTLTKLSDIWINYLLVAKSDHTWRKRIRDHLLYSIISQIQMTYFRMPGP